MRALRQCQRKKPTRLLHEWLAVNDNCDWVQSHFVELFTAEVLSEWYSRAGTWCQGCANLSMALLVGVDAWQMCRDFMNMRSREFRRCVGPHDACALHAPLSDTATPRFGRSDPKHAGAETAENVDDLIDMLRHPPRLPFAVYIELDCWNWKPPSAPASPDMAAPQVSSDVIEVAPGRHTASADIILDSSIVKGVDKGSGADRRPAEAAPPLDFGAAAAAMAASAATLPAELAKKAAETFTSAAAAVTGAKVEPLHEGTNASDATTDATTDAHAHAHAPPGAKATSVAEDVAEDLAEDVYVPLDVLHSGPINATVDATGDATGTGEASEPDTAKAVANAPEPAAPVPATDAADEAKVAPSAAETAGEVKKEDTAATAERVRREEVSEQRAVANEPDPAKLAPLVHGRRVFSRLHPMGSASARANGGHVFLVQIEAPDEYDDEGEEGDDDGEVDDDGEPRRRKKPAASGPCPPGELPLSCYTIYSSWSGRYTLQQWMENRPELIEMSAPSLDLWLKALKALIVTKHWSAQADELITFLFGAEMTGESDLGAPDDDEHASASEDGGLCDMADRFTAKMALDADITKDVPGSPPATAAATKVKETDAGVNKTATGADALTSAPVPPPRSPNTIEVNLPSVLKAIEATLPSPVDVGDASTVEDVGDGDDPDEDIGPSSDWVSPAEGWGVDYEDEVMWELHYWARGYDRTQLEYNAIVIEQLHKVRAHHSPRQAAPATATAKLSLHDG